MTHRARVMKILIIHIDCIIYVSSLRLSSAKSHFRIIKKIFLRKSLSSGLYFILLLLVCQNYEILRVQINQNRCEFF